MVRFSFPKSIAPELSVSDPAAKVAVPALTVVLFNVVLVRVVMVAEVCVPLTAPLIVGVVNTAEPRVTTDAVALKPLVNALPVPNRVYISEKLSLTLSAPILSESPVPSSAVVPIPID